MSFIFRIAIFGFFCIAVCRSHCQQVAEKVKKICKEREEKFGPDPECEARKCYEFLAKDAANVTIHMEEYVKRLEDILETQDLPEDALTYWYFTAENPRDPTQIDWTKESLRNISYDTSKTLVFGIHGYTDEADLNVGKMGDLVQSIVNVYKTNIIFPDFSSFNHDFVSVVTPNAYLASKQMAKYLQFFMEETGFQPEQIHIIGISLGGQMAAIIARFLPGKVGRISSLDPCGSIFNYFPEDLRLDRDDANFVDVIHAADETPLLKGWGFPYACGHLDFYVNGGIFQPGCNSTIPIYEDPKTLDEIEARVCMHQLLAAFWMESTYTNCTFIGTECANYRDFEKGYCDGNRQEVMGQYATKPVPELPEGTKFFLDTNASPPYCRDNPNALHKTDHW